MAKLFAIYQQPKDPAAFDSYYFEKHVPLAKTIPGLRGYEVTRGDVMGMGGKHGTYLIAVLQFDSMAAIGAAMASPQGQATAADLANFASGGVDVMFAETATV
ncbi:MAG TPA: EthD family reductase [Burkholderiaceae bacterium]|nr:EthD family reductase [Burkholderiaceae bacterium]